VNRRAGSWPPLLAVLLLLLSGCAQRPARPPPSTPSPPVRATPAKPAPAKPAVEPGGGLYAPHIKDSGPAIAPDISGIPEPIPVVEPLARYGNRSPYTVLGRSYHVMQGSDGYHERGVASWYGNKFHGRPTSSFEPYDMYKFTAAHRTLPLPSYVQVTNLDNGKSVVVRVNDRGPFHGERLIDLSYVAAVKLDMIQRGTARVDVRVLTPRDGDTQLAAADGRSAVMVAPAPAGRAYLQVASFGQKENAERLRERLQGSGIRKVQLQHADVAGQPVWRVRIGPYRRASNLERARGKVRTLGLGEPQTVAH
jgi:rare lipoprotein A